MCRLDSDLMMAHLQHLYWLNSKFFGGRYLQYNEYEISYFSDIPTEHIVCNQKISSNNMIS